MNRKLWRKALTAVLMAALLMTNSGMTSMQASAAEKVYIDGVYTNFEKATMAIGETRQIKAYVEPENATVQKLQYKSTNKKVATVSSKGLITAVGTGTTTIVVMAIDGSSQQESIKITVLKDLILSKKNVDSDNEIILLDKTFGNLIIDSSVGDADIYLAGIKVRNTLSLENGGYTVSLYDSTVKFVAFDEAEDEIQSLSTDKKKTEVPKLNVGEATKISEISAKISAMIRQEDGSQVDGLKLVQDMEGNITITLEDYHGKLLLDATFGDMEIVLNNCNITDVTVSGDENVGNIILTDGVSSSIENVYLMGNGKIDLGVPVNEILIDKSTANVALVIRDSVGTVINAGTNSKIAVSGSVDNFIVDGPNADIDISKNAYVGTLNLNGKSATIYGGGEVSETYVNADDCRIDIGNTLVTIGEVEGTLIQGEEAKGNSSVTTKDPVFSGGGGGGVPAGPAPSEDLKVGTVILDNTYEDRKNGLVPAMGNVSMNVVDGGYNSEKALMVTGKTADWNGVGLDLSSYLGKRYVLRIQADIKSEEAGNLYATMAIQRKGVADKEYPSVAVTEEGEADTWYSLDGTFALTNDILSATLYFQSPKLSDYYLDNVKITIDSIGDPVLVTGVTLEQNTLDLDIGSTKLLAAEITPSNADNKGLTWSSSDETVVSVSNGTIRALSAGTATITVKTDNGGFTDSCLVTVSSNVALALDYNTVILNGIGATKTVVANVAGVEWSSSDTSIATVDKGIITATGLGNATVTASLGDKSVSCNVLVDKDIIYHEDFEDDIHDLIYETWAITEEIQTDPAEAFNGNKYLKVENKNEYNGFTLTLDNSNGTGEAIFNMITFVKADSEDMGVEFFHDNPDLGYTITKVTATATEWVMLRSNDLKVAAGESIKVRLISSDQSVIYYMDDLYITKTASSDTPGGDTPGKAIFTNDFEDETAYGMLGTIGTGIYYEDEGAQDSRKSIMVIPSEAGWGNPGYDLTDYKGKTITVIANIKHDESESKEVKMTMQIGDDYPQMQFTLEPSKWTLVSKEFSISEEASNARIYFEDGSIASNRFLMDNILIYEGTLAQAEKHYADLFPAVTKTVIADSTKENYGLTVDVNAITGSAVSIDSGSSVLAIDGDKVASGESSYKVASIYLNESYIGQTIEIRAKVRRAGTTGSLTWQMYDGTSGISFAGQGDAEMDTWYEIYGEELVTFAGELYLGTYPGSNDTIYYITDLLIVAKKYD